MSRRSLLVLPLLAGAAAVSAQPAAPAASASNAARTARIESTDPACRPDYPVSAAQGTTVLRARVDETGRIVAVFVKEAAGTTRQHALLDRAALAVLPRCPAVAALDARGVPVASEIDVSYVWRLDGPPPVAAAAPSAPASSAGLGRREAAIAQVSRACYPLYPALAAKSRATGTTRLRFTVDGRGQVRAAEIVQSSGPSAGNTLLDEAARDALSKCAFIPGHDEQGLPAETQVDFLYTWRLD